MLMKKIFTLIATAALAISANAETKTVEITVTWPMAESYQEQAVDKDTNEPLFNEDGTPQMTTKYKYDFTPVVSANAECITVGEPVLGSEISWKEARGINNVAFATFYPSTQLKKVDDISDDHTVSFSLETKEGYTFEPTGFDYLGSVVGTDGGNYNLTYTWNGATETLQSEFHPNRNNEANNYYSDVKLPIEGATAASGKFVVTFYPYNLANNKQIGLSAVVIKGKLTGDNLTGLAEIVANEDAPVEYFNLQGVRVANPANGLYIKRQGNKVEKVYVK